MSKIFYIFLFLREFLQIKYFRAKSRTQLEAKQQYLWEKLKQSTLSKSDFYRPYINQPHTEWPIVNKAKHMEEFNQINTVGIDKIAAMKMAEQSEISRDFNPQLAGYSVGLSSGTSGNRGIFVASKKERVIWAANMIAKLLPIRFRRQRVAFFLRANNKLYETVNSRCIQFEFFDLLVDMEAHIDRLNQYCPGILIAPASVLTLLAGAKDKSLFINPSKIISVAEVLSDEDKKIIEGKFGQLVHQVYQCTEGFLAATCEYGNLHLNEESVLIEKQWVDKQSGIFTPIVTDLKRHSQPIVRYQLDDLLVESRESCDCGGIGTRVEAILGRCDDVLYLQKTDEQEEKPLFPDFITRSITRIDPEITEFSVLQNSPNLLIVYLPIDQEVLFPKVKSSLQEILRKQGFVIPEIRFEYLKPRQLHIKNRRVQRAFDYG